MVQNVAIASTGHFTIQRGAGEVRLESESCHSEMKT